MTSKLLPVVAVLVACAVEARADGCKFRKSGRWVPEREQRALIDWADGTETLHVAALSDPTTEGSVWVVPVRGPAAAVRAEPVDDFPAIVYYETLEERARERLDDAVTLARMLDSGGLCCPLTFIGCGGAGPAPQAVEVSRIERLGMVVTVVSARSRAEIERYLDAQGVSRNAADLSPLEPYFGAGEHAFVCGWVGDRGEPVTATGLKAVFPSPLPWFPLLPTRAYTDPVRTSVYVRGFVQPAPGCELPGLKCDYVYGAVELLGVRNAFTERRHRFGGPSGRYDGPSPLVPLTRVTLTTDPQLWDRDLEWTPGVAARSRVAYAVVAWFDVLRPIASALIGAVLGLLIPRLMLHRGQRRWSDYVAGGMVGAAIVLSIAGSLVALGVWRTCRFDARSDDAPLGCIALPFLAVLHFTLFWALCRGLMFCIGTI